MEKRITRRQMLKLTAAAAAGAGLGALAGCTGEQAPAPTQAPATSEGAAPTKAPEAAATTAPSTSGKAIDLDFVVWNYSVETILDNVKQFEALYDNTIKIKVSDFSWNAYHETIVNRLSSNTPTDVLYNGGDWLPEWAKAGWVIPIEGTFPGAEKYKDKIVGYALKDQTYDGKLYGLPYYSDLTTFQYNEKLLTENGEKVPETWEELTDVAKSLQGKGIEKPIIFEWAQALPTTLEDFTAMVFGRGGELLDENFDPIIEDPDSAAFKQLQWIADSKDSGILTLVPHETDVVKAMNTGQHVFTVLYNYNMAELNNEATSPLAGQFKIAMMPGETHETYGFSKFYCVTQMAQDRGPEVLDAVWKFIEYFGGEYEGKYPIAKRWAVEKGLGFGQLALYDDPDVQKSFGQFVDPEMLKAQAAKARARQQGVWYGIWSEFIRIQLVKAVAGEASVADAMKAAADKARQLKKQYEA